MKILFIHSFYQVKGGEDLVVEEEKKLLEKNGHVVYTYFKDNSEIKKYNIKEKLLFPFNSLFSFKTLKDLKKIIKEVNPDVAQVYNIFPLISPSVYWILKKKQIPVVQMVNNFRLLCLNGVFLDKKGICEKCKKGNFFHGIFKKCTQEKFAVSFLYAFVTVFIRKYFLNKIDMFIASNEFVKQKYIEAGFSPKKIKIKPNFISRNEAEIKAGKIPERYIVFIGRLSKEKGIFTLLNAMKYCKSIDLKILGDGPELNNIREFILENELDNVSLSGYVSSAEKDFVLKNAFFLILPSECYENFPLIILEAFRFGIPIIGSNHGAMESLIIENITGLHFKVKDAKDLAKKITKLWKSPELRKKLSGNAKKKVEENYSPEYSYRILQNVYDRIK